MKSLGMGELEKSVTGSVTGFGGSKLQHLTRWQRLVVVTSVSPAQH